MEHLPMVILLFSLVPGLQFSSNRARLRNTAPDRSGKNGTVHMICFKGDPMGGDIYYVRKDSAEKAFSCRLR